MGLSKEKIVNNAKKYYSSGEEYGFMNDALIEALGDSIVSAPASTRTDLHNAFEGGLIDHMLKTTVYAVKLNGILPEDQQVDKASLVRVCCLHQIGKANLYKPTTENWQHKKGIMYDFNNELTSMRIGERSAHLAMSNGITLSEEEYQAILNFDKENDKQAQYHTTTLGVILRQANELAIMEQKANV